MGVEGLPDDEGMLFLMPRRDVHTFWMNNVPMALDLAWLDGDPLVVNSISRGNANSRASISSQGPAKAVLELPRGWFDRHRLGPGAVLLIDSRPPPGHRRAENTLDGAVPLK